MLVGFACVLVQPLEVPSRLAMLRMRAPGRGKRLQEHAGLRRLLAGQVTVAATPHQRKLQQDDLGSWPRACGCQDVSLLCCENGA